jgi:hypothetical protein
MSKFLRGAVSLLLVLTLGVLAPLTALADSAGKQIQSATVGTTRTIDANFAGDSGSVYAIKNNGELWTVEFDSEKAPQKLLDDCVTISAMSRFVYALKADGTVWYIEWLPGSGEYNTEQITDAVPGISVLHMTSFISYGVLAVTDDGALYVYDGAWASLISGVKSICDSNGSILILKDDNSLWSLTAYEEPPVQITEGAQSLIERKFTNPRGGFFGTTAENAMRGDPLYIDENGALQYNGSANYEDTGETFDGMGSFEVAKDVADFVNTEHLTILKKDGTLLSGAYIDFGELVGELEVVLTDVRLPGAVSQNAKPPAANEQDIPSSWAQAAVESAKTLGLATADLTNGYQAATSRAEFCRAAVNFLRAYGYDLASVTPKMFADTDDQDIGIAAALGITSGTDTVKNLFTPDGSLTREQAATMLRNVLNVIGVSYDKTSVEWTDKAGVSSWAAEGVDVMYNAKIMGGTSATELVFSPKTPYTHEQSIITLVNLWEFVN